jgi:citrate lyase subunit gamma (acyl carrier protein)
MLEKKAQAGTLESSDCLVVIEPAETFSIDYRGQNALIFKKRTAGIVGEIAARYGVSATVRIEDRGALEATLRARVETAFERALEKD